MTKQESKNSEVTKPTIAMPPPNNPYNYKLARLELILRFTQMVFGLTLYLVMLYFNVVLGFAIDKWHYIFPGVVLGIDPMKMLGYITGRIGK